METPRSQCASCTPPSSCMICGLPSKFKCGRCKKASYCSRDCQKNKLNDTHKAECVQLPERFVAEDQTTLAVTRESLGVLIGREVDHHTWMLVSALRGTSSFGCEPGTGHLPDNAHGEKPYKCCTIHRDELAAFLAAHGKYLGNTEWNALVSAMELDYHYQRDVEAAYTLQTGRGTGGYGSSFEKRYNEFLVSRGITFKTPADVVRDVLKHTPIPPHFMGKYIG